MESSTGAYGSASTLRLTGVSKAFPLAGTRRERGRGWWWEFRRPELESLSVLEDISFEVHPRELVVVIGPSGCGKTTLIKLVHGLLHPDRGVVELDGAVVTRPTFRCGLVFQDAGLLPWRTALRNVEFGLETKGVDSREERRCRARDYLQLVGLDGFEDYYPHQLSGGMRQRVGLARALAIEPLVLLMDEPFAALDAQTRERMQEELLRLHATTQKTVLFVTHDLDEAVFVADRVVVLESQPGRVREIVDIDLPRPRPPAAEVKSMSEFVDKRHLIWTLIRQTESADNGSDANVP